MHLCMCVSICHVFYINLYISFIHKEIFTKFVDNVYYENMSVKNLGLILKNKMATIIIADCPNIKRCKT